ncbi:glycosyltransferase family 4 protein [Bacillus sp. CH30_1T]|uniref:glycosyltransferase n=1 Tax=Bacillus sp. CH30_1T TaxID=2604836 RepID=UPI0011EE6393|nr:glycosyltransferase [Bacillus sp. CH30_1T]KAA0565837.1 glycosyltransferase family 4 protein [Bacillus sp. CH30_1T]
MKKKIYMFGNFGYRHNNLNGQTMRTRTIFESLIKYTPEGNYIIQYTDTSIGANKKEKGLNYLKGLFKWLNSNIVIFLPAQKAIKFISPLFYYLNFILKKDLHFIAIGGWLAEFLEGNRGYIKYFKKVNYIYVQTESLKNKLEYIGFDNVIYFPNFRLYNNKEISLSKVSKVKKVVFFSRVIKEKGIELAISALNRINQGSDDKIELYIYGPIGEQYKEQFETIKNNSSYIYYNGVLEPNEILNELSKYDLMLFPTYYIGEGFPGTILDGMTAGLPVIASDWKYNSEVIKAGQTGLLFNNNDLEDLIKKMMILINDTDLVNQMKKNAILESQKFEESKVVPKLISNL